MEATEAMSLVTYTQCDAPLCTAQIPTTPAVSMKSLRAHAEALDDAGWSYAWRLGRRWDFCPEHEGCEA